MAGTTPNRSYPYPQNADPVNVAVDIQNLATSLDTDVAAINVRLAAEEAFSTAWTTYVPTLTQGVTVTNTVEFARYKKSGKKVDVVVSLAVTSTGTAGSAIVVGLPPLAPIGYRLLGQGAIYDASPGPTYYIGATWWVSATTANLRFSGFVGAAGTATGGFTTALASGDLVTMVLSYETA